MKKKMLPVLISAMFTGYTANSHAQANKQLSNLSSPTAINQSLLPNTDNSINLGDSSKQWKSLYLHDYLYLNGMLTMHTSGSNNYFNGPGAGNTAVTDYGHNTATGTNALHSLTSGYENTATGAYALFNNTTGIGNTASGIRTLYSNTTGTGNTAGGFFALFNNIDGRDNTATGDFALYSNISANNNTADGARALLSNTTGYNNTATGYYALSENTSGSANTATGDSALLNNTIGINNTAVGVKALLNNTRGTRNTALGVSAGDVMTTGIRNTFIGYHSNSSFGSVTNATALGNETIVTASNTVRIGNNAITSIGGYTDWSNISDGRIKKNIRNNVPGLAFINKLKPITYNLDLDAADEIIQYAALTNKKGEIGVPSQEEITARKVKEQVVYTGFVAQEVEKAAKELNYDFSGVDAAKNDKDLYGLRYAAFVVPLVKAVQELSQENETLKKQNALQQQKNSELENRLARLEAVMNGNSSLFSQQSGNPSFAMLLQNIPNPVSHTTTIGYSIPQQYNAAKLVITDRQGKTLKELNLMLDRVNVQVDVTALASGTYQYSLYADGKLLDSKSMMVAK